MFCENSKFASKVYRKRPSVEFTPTSKILYLKHCNLRFVFLTKYKIVTILHLKTWFSLIVLTF